MLKINRISNFHNKKNRTAP